jgi:putative hydrolase of HD superfamily
MKTNKQKISNRVKEILNFLIGIYKLKEMPRTGLVLLGVKDPPTIADHTCRVSIVAWLLGESRNLNIEKIIKIALAHDICEVYAGDTTPLRGLLPKNNKKRKEILKRWIRLPLEEKQKRSQQEFDIEKKCLLKLLKSFDLKLRQEFFSYWLEYKKCITKEGKFFLQTDKIEGMIEAIEHLSKKEYVFITPWWEEADELVADPLLHIFLRLIQNKFYTIKANITDKIYTKKLKRELENILDFLLEIEKLKRLPRRIWRLLEVKSPIETVADHIFSVALMAWIFGRQKPELNMEKLLKMALCHEMPSVYTNDLTPYDEILTKKAKKEVFKKWLRLPRKEKEKIHLKHYKKERIALKRLALKLDSPLRDEIIQLFDEYKTSSTAEARFLNQVNVLAVLLQALLYWKKDKNLQIDWIWEWAFEKCDNQICLDFIEELKNKFYGKGLISKLFNLLSFHKR